MTPNLIHFVHTNTQTANICQPLAALLATFAMMEYLLCQGAVFVCNLQRSMKCLRWYIPTRHFLMLWWRELERKDSVLNKNGGALSVCSQLCLMHDETKKIHNIMNMYILIYLYIYVFLFVGVGTSPYTSDCLHWFVMGFLGAAERKRNQAFISVRRTLIYKKKPFVPGLDPMNQAAFGLFSPCFYWFFGHHDEHPTQPLGHFMVCRSSCNKTLEMERWKGDSKGGQSSFHGPLFWCLWVPYSNCYLGLWLPIRPQEFQLQMIQIPRGSQKQIMPFLVLARW